MRCSGTSTLLITLMFAATATTALAQGAYKWVDKNGRTQYSDQPPVGVQSSQVERRIGSVASQPGAAKAGAATPAPRTVAEQEQAFRKRQMERQENDQKQARSAEETKQRALACSNARGRIVALDAGGRQVRFNERGERQYLDEAQIANERAQAQRDVAQACS